MNIRTATILDAPPIQRLSSQLGYDYPLDKTQKKLEDILQNPDHFVLISEQEGNVIAYLHMEIYRTLYFPDLLNILGLVIDEDSRHKGVGSLLLKEGEKIAGENDCAGIRANSGSSRFQAHQFYLRNGFDNQKDQIRFMKIF